MSQLTEEQQRQLVRDLLATVEKFAPEWTNHQSSDAGVTLLQLFAWLLDTLDYRANHASDRENDALKSLLAKLSALSSGACSTFDLTRPRYYDGQLLTASDLEAEQNYFRNGMKRYNRCVLGAGVVNGLRVSLDLSSSTKDKPSITVTPGCAIAPDGQLLCVCEQLRCALSTQGSAGYVVLRYCERAIDPVPTPLGSTEYSRIEEGVAVAFEDQLPGDGVAIALLKRKAGRWTVDRQFRRQKAPRRSS